ncbi:MAG TPA: serine/threonine-protein kinase [Stellaceae bacterium]|nr:serine/threonine-protein kinase [Stellaceae bacterium]
MSEPALPQTLGRYRLDAVLGRGAMGVVYKAHDPVIDRAIAIKVVHTDLLDGDERANFLAFFRREAQAAGRCMHPHIVTIYDFSDTGERPFIAMEYVDGETLHALLRRQGRLAVDAASQIVLQVLDALAYAHKLGIVHRDIKPANVILQRGAHVKITDFGVARLGQSVVTHAGGVVGTPSYMSPEQLSGGAIDGRTDLFAAGAMLYELLTGAKPFPGRDATEVMAMILHQNPPEPAELGASLPFALDAALRRALAKRADDRFQTADEFAEALRLAADIAASATGDADATVVAPRKPAQPPPVGGTWDEQRLHDVEREMARHVGPMARVLVRQAAGTTDTLTGLYRALAPHIRDEAQRNEFLNKARSIGEKPIPGGGTLPSGPGAGSRSPAKGSSPGPARGPVVVSPEQVAAAQEALTLHVGPMARVLVKQALAQATSPRDFLNRLADHIRREEDRNAFRRRLLKDLGSDTPG